MPNCSIRKACKDFLKTAAQRLAISSPCCLQKIRVQHCWLGFSSSLPAGGAGYLIVLPPDISRSVRPPSSSVTVQPTVMSALYPAAHYLSFCLGAGYTRCPISHVQHRNRERVGMQPGKSGLHRRVPVTCTITSMSMKGRGRGGGHATYP